MTNKVASKLHLNLLDKNTIGINNTDTVKNAKLFQTYQ